MAQFNSPVFGKISGKHGDVVAVTMKDGTTYFRAHIIPPNPNTIKQQSQRSKFGFAVKELNFGNKNYNFQSISTVSISNFKKRQTMVRLHSTQVS